MSKVAVTYIGRNAELAASLLEWSDKLDDVSITFEDFQREEKDGAEHLEAA